MTAPIGGTLGGAMAQVNNRNDQLGREEFLLLLVTQLRYQDPLSPMKADQLAVQLAQFSSVEQLIQINEKMQAQEAGTALLNLAMNTSIASSTIGKFVLGSGNDMSVDEDGLATVTVDVAVPGGRAEVTVFNSQGAEVGTFNLGSLAGGRQTLELDVGDSVGSGIYTYEVNVTDSAGNEIRVQHYTSGIVNGVQFAGGAVLLRSGDLLIPMASLIEIVAVPDDE